MRILVYGINYYPELTGIGKYTAEMCEWLAARGHQMEVITGMPYYPEWSVHRRYKGKWWHSEMIRGVKVVRAPLYVPEKVTGKSRILHELSFLLSTLLLWLPRFFRSYDVVISVCPPVHIGFFPYLYRLIRRKPFVFHVQDLQVDIARQLGLIRNKALLSLCEGMEEFLMNKATTVSVINEGMKKRIEHKGVAEEKIYMLPNWADTDFIRPLSRESSLKRELGFREEDRIVLYSGNIGDKQGLEMVINIADRMKDDPAVYFVFCGEGSSRKKLEGLAQARALKNVRFLELQPYDKLNRLLAMADLHLVIQKQAASDLVFPSKLSTILSAGGVGIITGAPDSGLYRLVKENGLGIVIEPENEKELFLSILENIHKDHSRIRDNARRFAENELNVCKILERFEQTLSGMQRTVKI